jgi:excisionase family DNA binding protein
MLSKKEAAEYLGISSRTLERHVKDGKIGVRYQPGATNDVAMFDEQDLENFKNERQTPKVKPTVVQNNILQESSELADRSANNQIAQASGGFLAPLIAPFKDFSQRLFSSPFLLQGKILVSLNEAQIITGLSREILMTAIKNGELESQIMGKAYRIKRKELERYIDELWLED